MWRTGLRGDGRRLFEDLCEGIGSSGLGFTVDCHLIETVNANCFLNARDKKKRKFSIKDHSYFLLKPRM